MGLKRKLKSYMENYILNALMPVFHRVYSEQPLDRPTIEELTALIRDRLKEQTDLIEEGKE